MFQYSNENVDIKILIKQNKMNGKNTKFKNVFVDK